LQSDNNIEALLQEGDSNAEDLLLVANCQIEEIEL
jgi:hypothetical protein